MPGKDYIIQLASWRVNELYTIILMTKVEFNMDKRL